MAVDEAAGLDERNSGKLAVGDVGIQVCSVLDVRLANRFVGHDGSVVLERVADVAVLVRVGNGLAQEVGRAGSPVVDLVFILGNISGFTWRASSRVVVPLISVILPRNVLGEKFVANAARG